jgi:hypothetical protein
MNFTSIMHNLINQMLLSINAKPAAEAAIAAVRRGEKPLIALAKTNESFLKDYAKGGRPQAGDAVDLDFTRCSTATSSARAGSPSASPS